MTAWRHTRAGWELPVWRVAPAEPHRPELHPAVVAALQIMLSLWALVALSTPKRERPADEKPYHPARIRLPLATITDGRA
jgi:hypothetical protein